MSQLAEMFGWAGPELAAAVLEAVGQDVAAAASILADMVAPEPALASAADGAVQAALGDVPAVRAAAAATVHNGPASQLQQGRGSGSGSSGSGADSDDEPGADPYWRHRRHALLLSRRWQRAARGAAAAYAGGCHGEARRLAAQAQRLRSEALAAHAEAAERIETENNQHNRCGWAWAAVEYCASCVSTAVELLGWGRPVEQQVTSYPGCTVSVPQRPAQGSKNVLTVNLILFLALPRSLLELDLHGLHTQEATAAVDRRLQLLHSLLADPATALALSSGTGGGSAAAPRSGRPTLRVVVGKGLHSSGGEASIPRVVESHLAAAGLKYTARGGAIDVQLRAPPGAAAAAAAAAGVR